MGLRFPDPLIVLIKFTIFALVGDFPLNSPYLGKWVCELPPIDLVEFASSISSKSIWLIIASSDFSDVCAETDASYYSPGLKIR